MATSTYPLDLSTLRLRASIDFVTIRTPGHCNLPAFQGILRWAASKHYKQLTVHEPHPRDIATLIDSFPGTSVEEIEIAVDLSPVEFADLEDRNGQLVHYHQFISQHLHPYSAPFLESAKTAAFCCIARKLKRFNLRVPKPHEQLLYGLRDDQPAQVKVYSKITDMREPIKEEDHVVRVEVNLKRPACSALGLDTIDDVLDYPFRTRLSPYFRLVRSPVSKLTRSKRRLLSLVKQRQRRVLEAYASEVWQRLGVQGTRIIPGLRYLRHSEANQRIGKALGALETQMSRTKLARVLESVSGDCTGKSAAGGSVPVTTITLVRRDVEPSDFMAA